VSEPFLGEIRIFPYNFAPRGWAFCQGQLLPISQNTAVFSLLGTTYGGDGIQTFALPDLRGRVAISSGQGPGLSNHTLGEVSGTENTTLTVNQMPQHNHTAMANDGTATTSRPNGAALAHAASNVYAAAPNGSAMNAGVIAVAGGSQPFGNLQPFLVLNFCIALQGVFPSRN
jgi:microcystin-dependent protein